MGATNPKDTFKAASLFLILWGFIHLFDRFLSWSSLGLSWVMQKDSLLLYAAVIFLWFMEDKTVGVVLSGLWIILNIGLIIALLGHISAYLLPVAFLLVGVILYIISIR